VEREAIARQYVPMEVMNFAKKEAGRKKELTDTSKNRVLKKFARKRKGGSETLFAASNDFLFHYDFATSETTTFELLGDKGIDIDRLPPVSPEEYSEEVEHLTNDLRILTTLVQHYLRDVPG